MRDLASFLSGLALTAVLAAVLMVTGRPAMAADRPGVPDITDFSLGLEREELELRPLNVCGDRLCGEVAFGDMVWNGVFTLEDDRLKAISLTAPTDELYMKAALGGFGESPYVIQSAVSDVARFYATPASSVAENPDAGLAGFLRSTVQAGCSFASFFYVEKDSLGVTNADTAGGTLTLTPSGINILIMNAGELQREIETRTMRIQVAGERSR